MAVIPVEVLALVAADKSCDAIFTGWTKLREYVIVCRPRCRLDVPV